MLSHCIALVGGRATRLRPVSDEIPKALIPIHGKPLCQHVLECMVSSGIRQIIFSAGYKAEQIIGYYKQVPPKGVHVHVYVEESPCGTGGALRDLIDGNLKKLDMNPPVWVVINGDNLIDVDMNKVYVQHNQMKPLVTMLVKKMPDTSEYGRVEIDWASMKATGFTEKGVAGEGYINAGWYIFDPAVLNLLPEEPKPFSLEKGLFPDLAKKGMLGVYDLGSAFFSDCGDFTRWQYVIDYWKKKAE